MWIFDDEPWDFHLNLSDIDIPEFRFPVTEQQFADVLSRDDQYFIERAGLAAHASLTLTAEQYRVKAGYGNLREV